MLFYLNVYLVYILADIVTFMSVYGRRRIHFLPAAISLCTCCLSGSRDMPQSVPKQKKKAQQYKGQKKSEYSFLLCQLISLHSFLRLSFSTHWLHLW